MDNNKCLANIVIDIEHGIVVSYINGEKVPDAVPNRAKLILSRYIENSNTIIKDVIIDYGLVQRILELDSFVTKELILESEGLVFDDEELAPLSEYIPQILKHLRGLGLTRSNINENFIRQLLYTVDLVVMDCLDNESDE